MTVTYREASTADAVALDRIFDTSFCDTFAHLYRREDLELFLLTFGSAIGKRSCVDPAYAFRLPRSTASRSGYVKLGPLLKLPVDPDGPAILLDQLYIIKEHHGAGIAQDLMDWALGEANKRGAEEMYLTVFVDNHRARRFYDRYGFEAVGRYDFMVGNHADEDIIMRKRL